MGVLQAKSLVRVGTVAESDMVNIVVRDEAGQEVVIATSFQVAAQIAGAVVGAMKAAQAARRNYPIPATPETILDATADSLATSAGRRVLLVLACDRTGPVVGAMELDLARRLVSNLTGALSPNTSRQ